MTKVALGTKAQAIFAAKSGRRHVSPGEVVWCDVDMLMIHDVCGPGAIRTFRREFIRGAPVWNREKVTIVCDHFVCSNEDKARRNIQELRDFSAEQGIRLIVPDPCGYHGISHLALLEQELIGPGHLVVGADSHTTGAGAVGALGVGVGETEAGFVLGTGRLWFQVPESAAIGFEGTMPDYLSPRDLGLLLLKEVGRGGARRLSLEFVGPALASMTRSDRMILAVMGAESGAKCVFVDSEPAPADRAVPGGREGSAGGAGFVWEQTWRVDAVPPLISLPGHDGPVVPVEDAAAVRVDCAYLGSCCGGTGEELIRAARVLDGRRVAVRTLCSPASTDVRHWLESEMVGSRSAMQILVDAGVEIIETSCGACAGGPPDVPGRLENHQTCIATTPRNYPGRMGAATSRVYLASAATVAASAVRGSICDPRRYVT